MFARVRLTHLCAMAVAGAILCTGLTPEVQAKGKRRFQTVLDFDSRLKDEQNRPVSGIFKMSFTLRNAKNRRKMWRERHWVAVDNGRYSVQLGRKSKLPKSLDPDGTSIEVAISGAGVVLKQLVSGAGQVNRVRVSTSRGRAIVKYAEKSGFAYDSEHATTADRLGPYTSKSLKETLDKLKKRKSKVVVSRNRINLTSAGGVGGKQFEQICPPGTVAVGLRGGSGIYIDNVQIICAPLK
ncbi:MAG: hypothetical protein CMH53_00690 [Myxococcales bacterium]|nr:hypothetical protein [Myxococcales bacterium]